MFNLFLIQRITLYRYTNVHCRPTAAFQQGNDIRSCFFVGNPDTYTEYDFALIRCIRIIYKKLNLTIVVDKQTVFALLERCRWSARAQAAYACARIGRQCSRSFLQKRTRAPGKFL